MSKETFGFCESCNEETKDVIPCLSKKQKTHYVCRKHAIERYEEWMERRICPDCNLLGFVNWLVCPKCHYDFELNDNNKEI